MHTSWSRFAAELRAYRGCFKQDRTAKHFDTYCRGLLADLPRKTVEPIAVRDRDGGASERADQLQPGADTDRWRRFRVPIFSLMRAVFNFPLP